MIYRMIRDVFIVCDLKSDPLHGDWSTAAAPPFGLRESSPIQRVRGQRGVGSNASAAGAVHKEFALSRRNPFSGESN